MYYAFQDRENLYLVMDLLTGGDLRYHICKYRKFDEETTSKYFIPSARCNLNYINLKLPLEFWVACLVAGLEICHEKNIIHRDIKPENLVIDQDGYLRITDFGIARVWRPENAQDTSGTPGYMAPEVMCRVNHTTCVDYFAVGVMAYECMFGRRPYVGKSRKEIRDHILSKQV
jgi:serine/threonine protein kinase